MRRIRYDSERELRDAISESLCDYGWDTETEVTSECGSGRVDIIAEHPNARVVGIEVKNMENYSGKKIGEAIKQVQRYSNLDFQNKNVNYWAIAPGVPNNRFSEEGSGRGTYHTVMDVFQATINQFGIGFLHRRNEEIKFEHGSRASISLSRPETTDKSNHWSLERVIEKRRDY